MFISAETHEYPLTLSDVRLRLPQTLMPSNPTDEQMVYVGFPRVQSTAKPGGDVVTEGEPEWRDGVPYQTWNVRDYTPEELEAMKPPPVRYYTEKARVWDQERVSDDDLEALANAIDSMSFRLRRQWADTMYLFHDDEPYLTVRANLTGVLSEEKIDRIFQQDGFEQA